MSRCEDSPGLKINGAPEARDLARIFLISFSRCSRQVL